MCCSARSASPVQSFVVCFLPVYLCVCVCVRVFFLLAGALGAYVYCISVLDSVQYTVQYLFIVRARLRYEKELSDFGGEIAKP